jgi:hypothetical protein
MYNHAHFQGSAKIGGGQLISLVAPRQRIRITGAPESVFAANPPEAFRPALRAHWDRDYAEAEKRITALIDGGTLIGEELTKALQLQRVTRELQESIAYDLDKVEALIKAGKLYEAGLDLVQLQHVLPVNHERLVAIESVLSAPENAESIEQDKVRYLKHQESLRFDRLLPDTKDGDNAVWTPLTTISEYSSYFSRKRSAVPESHATVWRMKIVEAIGQAPEGWTDLDFNDSDWNRTTLPISWPLNHTVLFRAPFEITDKRTVEALRLRKYTFRQQNMEIFINGVPVAKINNANAESILDIPLNDGARRALRNGSNVIAATFRNNWRWGRYTRRIEMDADNSVYNNGVALALEMRE